MTVHVSAKGVGLDRLLDNVRNLTRTEVLVGIPAENQTRTPQAGETKALIGNAAIGYLMENGSPAQNIPARPFLAPGVEGAGDQIAARLRAAGEAALISDQSAMDRSFNAAGLIAQSSVQRAISEGSFAPLSERTLKARRARGRTGEKPLIDTGQLRRAVTYVIRKRGA